MLIFVTSLLWHNFYCTNKKEQLGHFYTSGQMIYFIISYLVYK